MIVITLARKPLSGTVASTAVKFGTGGINIDECRIAHITVGKGNLAQNTHLRKFVRKGVHLDPTSWSFPPGLSEVNQTGRWPANLILEHKPGCRCFGTRQVKATALNSTELRPTGRAMSPIGTGLRPRNPGGTVKRHTDGDGNETVPLWNCVPGCPVAELDLQSGDRRSTLTGKADPSVSHATPAKPGQNPDRVARHLNFSDSLDNPVSKVYADSGGASRFFYQIQGAPKP